MLQIFIKLEVKMVIWLQKALNQEVFTNFESFVVCHRMGYTSGNWIRSYLKYIFTA